jgi:MFS family permease
MSIWTKNFIFICISNLAMFISIHVLTPTLPVYLIQIGGSEKDVGYVMAAYTFGATIARPIGGWLLDRFNRKKILLIGMAVMIGVSLLYQLGAEISFLQAIRCLHGLLFGLISTALGTMAADSLPPAHLGEGMGYYGLTNSISMSLAPMIGFWLVGKSDFSMLFFMVSILTTLAFCCGLTVESNHAHDKPTPTDRSSSILEQFMEKSAIFPSIMVFFFSGVYGAILSFISLYGTERGIANVGLFFTFMSLTMLVSRPISGRWTDRGGTDMVLLISHLAIFIGIIAITMSHTITELILAGVSIGLGYGFCWPTLQAEAVRHAPRHKRGAATATFFIFVDLGIGLGTILWGYVAEATSYRMMYFSTLIPIIIAAVIYFRFKNLRPSPIPENKYSKTR